MALNREERKLLHQKSKEPTFGNGKPDKSSGNEGDISFRKVQGSGTVQYLKQDGDWIAISSSGIKPLTRTESGNRNIISNTLVSTGVSDHSDLIGLNSDDHPQYILVDGTRAFSGNVTVGSDGSGYDVTFHSSTSGDSLVWDSSEELLTITGTDGQTALNIADGNVTISDTLTSTNIGAFTLTGKLTAGSSEIEGSAFDIDGGTVDSITSLTIANDVDMGDFKIRAKNFIADQHTSSRVFFVGTNGELKTDSDITFSGDTLTVTKIGAFTAAGAINFDNQDMTNVDIDSGAIDGTTIGASSHTTIKGTTIDATTDFTIGGTVITDGNIDDTGTLNIDGATGINLQEGGTTVINIDTDRDIFFNQYTQTLFQQYGFHNKATNYHFTSGQADFEENYSMVSSHNEITTTYTYPTGT